MIINKLSDIRMSKAELARRFGMKSVNTLNSRLNGTTEWTFNEIWLMTQLFDCEMDELISNQGQQ